MSDEFKKRLFAHFFKDVPITFDSITEDQWNQLADTFAGHSIALSMAWKNIVDAILPPFESAVKVLNDAFKNIGKKEK